MAWLKGKPTSDFSFAFTFAPRAAMSLAMDIKNSILPCQSNQIWENNLKRAISKLSSALSVTNLFFENPSRSGIYCSVSFCLKSHAQPEAVVD